MSRRSSQNQETTNVLRLLNTATLWFFRYKTNPWIILSDDLLLKMAVTQRSAAKLKFAKLSEK